MKFVGRILLNSVVLIAVAGFMDSFHISDIWTAVLASFLLAVIDVTVKPIFTILTLPITFFTMGVFLLFINTFMLLFVSGLIETFTTSIFEFGGFFSAFLASIFISTLNRTIDYLIRTKE